jgi:hypothetical protein
VIADIAVIGSLTHEDTKEHIGKPAARNCHLEMTVAKGVAKLDCPHVRVLFSQLFAARRPWG